MSSLSSLLSMLPSLSIRDSKELFDVKQLADHALLVGVLNEGLDGFAIWFQPVLNERNSCVPLELSEVHAIVDGSVEARLSGRQVVAIQRQCLLESRVERLIKARGAVERRPGDHQHRVDRIE